MERTEIILIGGGGHARVVADCMQSQGVIVNGFFDNRDTGHVLDLPFLGVYNPIVNPHVPVVIAIGDNTTRKRIALQEVKHSFFTVIHSSTQFSSHAKIGWGSMILQGTIVQAQAIIGNHVIINTGASVDHDCHIADYVHLAPGVILCGQVTIGEGSFVGAGATVIPGKRIGAWAIIGAGAVVINDIPDYAVAVGNPARIIKYHKP